MENKNKQTVEINTDIIKKTDLAQLEDANWESLVQMGQNAGEIKLYSQWVLGMLGDAVAQKYGDLKKYAQEIRQDYGSLRQYINTYRKFIKEDNSFHPQKYFGSVSWGVLALAATKSDTPQKLVDELQDENCEVSLKSAFRRIKSKESPDEEEPPKKPVIKLKWDKNAKLYKINIDLNDFELIDWSAIKNDLNRYLGSL